MSFAGKWMELKIMMSSEINQSYKVSHFSFICGNCKETNNKGHESKIKATRKMGG
jgi:hypothetical protein